MYSATCSARSCSINIKGPKCRLGSIGKSDLVFAYIGPLSLTQDRHTMKQVEEYVQSPTCPTTTISANHVHKLAAITVLQQERRPMAAADIYKAAVNKGLLSTGDATSKAQMMAVLCGDIEDTKSPVFTSHMGGRFGLKCWTLKHGTDSAVNFAVDTPLQASSAAEGSVSLKEQLNAGLVQQQPADESLVPACVPQLLGAQHQQQQYRLASACSARSHPQLEALEPVIPAQQQQEHRGFPASQHQLQTCLQETLPINKKSPKAYPQTADALFVAQDGGGGRRRRRSSSGLLLLPLEHNNSRLLGLQELTSPTPCAAKLYISNDGTTIAPGNQQHKRLSLLIPVAQGNGAVATAAGSGHPSPADNMMASLLAETSGAAHSVVNTPWGSHPSALASLFSPSNGNHQDAACSDLATPMIPETAPASVRRTPVELTSQEQQQNDQQTVEDDAGQSHDNTAQKGRKRSYDAILLDPRCAEVCNAAQAAAVAAMGGSGSGSLDMVALVQWQQTIEAAEQHWGPSHPAVGRAWLELARVWQATDKENDRAKHATKKAFDICQILLQQTAMESRAQQSYQYLLDKFNRKSSASKRAQQAAVVAASEAARAVYETSTATAAATPVTVPGLMALAPAIGMHTAPQQQYQQQYPAVTLVPGVYVHPDAGAIYAHWGLPQGLPVAFTTQTQSDTAGVAMQQAATAAQADAGIANMPLEHTANAEGQGVAFNGLGLGTQPAVLAPAGDTVSAPPLDTATGGAGSVQATDNICKSAVKS